MDNVWLTAATVLVPLLAGLGLIAALARGILNNPGVSNSNAIVLGIAALLCVAPTVLNLAIKLPGGTEISLVREQLQTQTQQIKNDFGEQGASVRGQIEALRKRVDALEKGKSAAATPAAQPPVNANSGKVVVVLYVADQKDLALQMQNYLLQQGYSANAVYRFHRVERRQSPGARHGDVRLGGEPIVAAQRGRESAAHEIPAGAEGGRFQHHEADRHL